MSGLSDTIAAIATATGKGGVGIVRISGPQAFAIADQVFKGKKPSEQKGGQFVFGQVVADTEVLDECVCLIFRGPYSYTGEDVIELQTHGSPAVLARVLSQVLMLGARLAKAGEFTLRAYLAGRIDLAQAESVLQLIEANTETARRQGVLGLSGALKARIDHISEQITNVLAALSALLDYPEEGVPPTERTLLWVAEKELEELLQTAKAGQWTTRGIRLALIGRPNAGKSSLLNALVGYERSIVTPVAGTTRDYLEVGFELGGFPITLVDTAGLRTTEDEIEAAGIAQAKQWAEHADLVLVLEDGSQPREELDLCDDRVIRIQTKSDLPAYWQEEGLLRVSAQTGEGLAALRTALLERIGNANETEVWLSTERQADAARRALEHVRSAQYLPDDLASYELEQSLEALAEITGRDVKEDVVDAVFRQFCVGK